MKKTSNNKKLPLYQWFNGKTSACHADAPGSIPGWYIVLYKE